MAGGGERDLRETEREDGEREKRGEEGRCQVGGTAPNAPPQDGATHSSCHANLSPLHMSRGEPHPVHDRSSSGARYHRVTTYSGMGASESTPVRACFLLGRVGGASERELAGKIRYMDVKYMRCDAMRI